MAEWFRALGPDSRKPQNFNFRAQKAIFTESVFKDREVYTPITSCMKRITVCIKNM